MKGTILWDFDGTLAERPFLWSGSIKAALDLVEPNNTVSIDEIRQYTKNLCPWNDPTQEYGHLVEATKWWSHVGERISFILEKFIEDRNLIGLALKHVQSSVWDASKYQIYADTLPTLKHLSDSGWDHVIVSNNFPELDEVVAKLDIAPLISRVFSSARIGYEKPRPELFHYVLERIEHRQMIWMVGDNEVADALGAEKAGIPAILVRKPTSSFHRRGVDLYETAKIISSHQ